MMLGVSLLWFIFNLIFFICLTLNLENSISLALPLKSSSGAAGIEVPPPEILRFMRRFGYLEANPNDSESLYHGSAIVEAIRNIQKYGALNQTGKLDNETLELFTKPRCGVPDIEGIPYYLAVSSTTSTTQSDRHKRYVIGARTWRKRRIRYFIANWSLKIPQKQVERDVERALALWAQYSGLHFVRVNHTSADIIIGFGSQYHGDNYPFDGPGNILAHAYYPYEMGSWGGDVHFDEDENWKENSTELTNGVDFYAVTAHELGHSLGLAHSTVYSSIMFPYYKGPKHSTLDYDDILAMYEMYVSKVLDDDNVSPPSTTTDNSFLWQSTSEQSTTTTTTERSVAAVTSTYRGDYESATQHKHRYAFLTPPTTTTTTAHTTINNAHNNGNLKNDSLLPIATTTTTKPKVRAKPILTAPPNICLGNFDAVTVLNGSVLIFKKQYIWKLTKRYTIMSGYPRSIYEMFPFLPAHIKNIDAAYERFNGAGVFFTGQLIWIFNGTNELIEDSPRQLSDLIGNDLNVRGVDAAMVWPKNNFTYIFAGTRFWRFNDALRIMDYGYPKSMSRWIGIPNSIDAAATLTNGKTYFFKHNIYWLYDNVNVRPQRGYPRRASSAWLGCAIATKTPLRNSNTTVSFIAPFASFLT